MGKRKSPKGEYVKRTPSPERATIVVTKETPRSRNKLLPARMVDGLGKGIFMNVEISRFEVCKLIDSGFLGDRTISRRSLGGIAQ